MELLLNLFWLLLAMPAFWLWHYSRTASTKQKANPFYCLLALGCMLVILFPVISATDDLCAMRAEMEESPASKRSVGQSSGDKSASSNSRSPLQPVLTVTVNLSVATDFVWYQPPSVLTTPATSPIVLTAPRGPPSSVLA